MPPDDTPVVIAGAGIGGLATAIACARKNIPSIVCERRSAFSEEGAGLQMGPNGTRILHELGVATRLKSVAAVPDGISVMNLASGKLLTRLPLGAWVAARYGSPYWTVHRHDLHAVLLEHATANPMITIRPATAITGHTEISGGIGAVTSNAQAIPARALIAADGMWSALRASIAGNASLRPIGKNAYRSVVPASALPPELPPNDVTIWLGSRIHIVHYPVRAGRETALVVVTSGRSAAGTWTSDAPPGWFEPLEFRLPAPLRTLLKEAPSWRMWTLLTMPPLRTWVKGRAALLGDAAHPVLPFLAQGAVLTLEDAVTLAARLARADGDEMDALRAYEAVRKPRADRVAAASRGNGRVYHLSGLVGAARDRVLRTVPAPMLMARYDWLYGAKAE